MVRASVIFGFKWIAGFQAADIQQRADQALHAFRRAVGDLYQSALGVVRSAVRPA
jgi:hypothetical protein